ncbi:hypothetical protein TNCV_2766581 [Trichonephila clavipes]|nr:hypothetical protein TNCV_2766581 [Trichonephila clavipes]
MSLHKAIDLAHLDSSPSSNYDSHQRTMKPCLINHLEPNEMISQGHVRRISAMFEIEWREVSAGLLIRRSRQLPMGPASVNNPSVLFAVSAPKTGYRAPRIRLSRAST